ncbi:hypothetical protein SLEP1_g54079 [Rubroshorea leprosula]|uniref:Uncharacterized protein n=1 Tax=Rubroshorea leprosula TaxID=152421 RepID=A0AAV5MD71_9ROSI|nr:hypothetical protein SLEP1_g54079 [Rubroshorea leprosula]
MVEFHSLRPRAKPTASHEEKPIGSLKFLLFSCSRTRFGAFKSSPAGKLPDLRCSASSRPAAPTLWGRIGLVSDCVNSRCTCHRPLPPTAAPVLLAEILVCGQPSKPRICPFICCLVMSEFG